MNEPTRIQTQPPQAGFVPRGTTLNNTYEIDAPLAKGGMGEVYRGHGIITREQVAIKLIRSDMADNEAALDLFTREANALSRLHHEAIVRYFVFAFDLNLRRHFLAMEFVKGVSLAELASRGPLRFEDARGLLKRIALGLQAAHERGVVHRDISPDNIIVEDGDVTHARIIDFGIARSTRVGDGTVIGGGFAGKHNYVSPEQLGFFGGDVKGTSDIYSLGLVIAQCLRGKALDMGGSQYEIMEKRKKIPALQGIDARFVPLLESMLQPDPANRPVSMADVVARLPADAPEAAPTRKPPLPSRKGAPVEEKAKSPRRAVVSLFALALVVGAGAVGYLQYEDEARDYWGRGSRWVEAWLRPAVPAPGPKEPEPGPTIPVKITPEPPRPPTAAELVANYVRDYDGGECFLAMPIKVAAKSAKIEVFAPDEKPAVKLDEDFTQLHGWDADVRSSPVAREQCAALRFVRALRVRAGARQGKLEIIKPALRGDDVYPKLNSGELLAGSFTSEGASATLLLVDDNGNLLDLTSKLSEPGPVRQFSIANLRKAPGLRFQKMMLLAISGAREIRALRPTATTGRSDLFDAALREIEARPQPLEVGVKNFQID